MSDAVEAKVINAIIMAWTSITNFRGRPTTFEMSIREREATAQSAFYTLKSLGWPSPEDLAARDKAVRDAALEMAAQVIDAYGDYDSRMCCDGRECGCQGVSVHQTIQHYIRSLKSTPTRFQEVREGYVVVPVEPTEVMLKAGSVAFYGSKQDVLAARLPEVYRAMLKVKP